MRQEEKKNPSGTTKGVPPRRHVGSATFDREKLPPSLLEPARDMVGSEKKPAEKKSRW